MSTPEHPHTLRREIERGAGGQYVPARFAQMRCDGMMGRCPLPPIRAPRVIVSPTPFVLGQSPKPLRMMTTLHYCERHKGEITLDALLQDKVKADFERTARLKWSHEYRPDFDTAFIEWVLVTTPEYRAFLLAIEIKRSPKISAGGGLLLR